jgi:hypothetical protein
MSDIRQFTPVFFLQLSRIARQGLSLCTAKIVFFPEVSLSVVDLVVYLCQKSLLVEVGAQTNTKEEAYNAMEPLADILDKVLK